MTSSNYRFVATGTVANERISPLLPSDWTDTTNDDHEIVPDFLWENAPRRQTKGYRDTVKVYSHLPNGTSLLDSKWALGRLFADTHKQKRDGEETEDLKCLAKLETHCFRGLDGFEEFTEKVKLHKSVDPDSVGGSEPAVESYPDIMKKDMDLYQAPSTKLGPSNLWVVKDAMANGAGGVWVVGPENKDQFASKDSSPLYPEHRYVAQRYVWPPVLFDGRKCHVRVYGLFTSDERAFVHHRAFLHVANDKFTTKDASQTGNFQDSIHITNCCANSHDDSKFAGEILADFEESEYTERDGQTVVPLANFFPSVRACISYLARKSFPFLQGGQANHGFEYMGIDFMLSYDEDRQPLAYILEINAPPSQDTATGLPHAENLHNNVIQDLTTLWVVPNVTGAPERAGGWRCVYSNAESKSCEGDGDLIVPSKAAIINKIRWAMSEKKALRQVQEKAIATKTDHECDDSLGTNAEQGTHQNPLHEGTQANHVAGFARSKFPYFSDSKHHRHRNFPQVFFENAGGSQVAEPVVKAVSESLVHRHRSKVGSRSKSDARQSLRIMLGARDEDTIFLGPNATSLLVALAGKYVRHGLLAKDDEIVVSTENHSAHFDPWIQAARDVGAVIKLWTPFRERVSQDSTVVMASPFLADLISSRTRIVALTHASNVLGQLRDIKEFANLIKNGSEGRAHIVVDGVAATPHVYAAFRESNVDWYVVSCHKLFGPHLGALCGKRQGAVEQLLTAAGSSSGGADDSMYKLLESGTVNYEGCAGVIGLKKYFGSLASFPISGQASSSWQKCIDGGTSSSQSGENCGESSSSFKKKELMLEEETITTDTIQEAYRRIRIAEAPLVEALLQGLRRCKSVRIIEGLCRDQESLGSLARLPTVSFTHGKIRPAEMVAHCEEKGISCRYSSFLCTSYLADDFGFDLDEGVVRVSLAHYNTLEEIKLLFQTLETLPEWHE